MIAQIAAQDKRTQTVASEWDEVSQKVLESIDIAAECAKWGVRFSSEHISPSGWRACHAIDREDANPSACVNVGGSGNIRGRYKDSATGLSLSFWDLAVKSGNFSDWKEVRRHYARAANIKMPEGAEPKRPTDDIQFGSWIGSIASLWCALKGGEHHSLSAKSLEEIGCRMGFYPASLRTEQQTQVVAFPAFMPARLDEEPRGWVMLNTDGGPILKYQGRDKPPVPVKTQCTGSSLSGLLNRFALERLANAEVVWWTEGVTDMVSLHGLIPAAERDRHVCLTNAFGCQESVAPEWAAAMAGKIIYLPGDADVPGQLGAAKKASYLVPHAKEVRIVKLPYDVEEKHGKDIRDLVRDWLAGMIEPEFTGVRDQAGCWQYFVRLAAASPPMVSSASVAATPAQAAVAMGSQPTAPPAGAIDPLIEEKHILDLLQIQVLGHHADGAIEIYSRARREVFRIPNASTMRYGELLLYCGDRARDYVVDGRGVMPGKIPLDQVRNAISLIAGSTSLEDSQLIGQGIWPVGQDIVVVNGGEAAIYRAGKLVLQR